MNVSTTRFRELLGWKIWALVGFSIMGLGLDVQKEVPVSEQSPRLSFVKERSAYVVSAPNMNVRFEEGGVQFDYYRQGNPASGATDHAWKMQFVTEGKSVAPQGEYAYQGSNRNFKEVRYPNCWNGVDVLFYSDANGQLEFDFEFKPGVDVDAIKLRFAGCDDLRVDEDGSLLVPYQAG